jgi:hypothetical protein
MLSLASGPALALIRRSGVVAATAAAATLLAGCGSGTPTAAPTKTVTATAGTAATPSAAASSASATTPPAAAGPGTCSATDLRASLGQGSGAAGTFYQLIVLTNTSSSACTLYGYPGVSFVTGQGGSVIGAPATRNSLIKDTLVTLQPGGTASALVGVVDAGALPQAACQPGKASLLQIYPPADLGSLDVKYDSEVCTKPGEKFMTVTAVHAGTSSSF